MAARKCPTTDELVLPVVGHANVACDREPGHAGSHHDCAWEVYWSPNSAGVMTAVTDHLSHPQANK